MIHCREFYFQFSLCYFAFLIVPACTACCIKQKRFLVCHLGAFFFHRKQIMTIRFMYASVCLCMISLCLCTISNEYAPEQFIGMRLILIFFKKKKIFFS